MRQKAWDRLQREWKADVAAVADGLDTRMYPQGWALGEQLEDEPQEEIKPTTMREILRIVGHIVGIAPQRIRSTTRRQYIARRRYMVVELISRLRPDRTLTEIGAFMNRDHTTIIHAMRKFPIMLRHDDELAAEWRECCRHFGIKP